MGFVFNSLSVLPLHRRVDTAFGGAWRCTKHPAPIRVTCRPEGACFFLLTQTTTISWRHMLLSYYLNKICGAPPGSQVQVQAPPGHVASSVGLSSSLGTVLGLLSNSYVGSSLKLLVLGSVVETGRRLFMWLIERFGIRTSLLCVKERKKKSQSN
jgi:hypothetical protein